MKDILVQLTTTAMIVAGIVYLAKKVVENWFSRGVEKFKADLEHQSELALDGARQELRIEEVRQGRLHERQATIVAGVFARLERTHNALRIVAAPTFHHDEDGGARPLLKNAWNAFQDLQRYYHERAVWLDLETCRQLNGLVVLIGKLLSQMGFNVDDAGQVADRAKWIATFSKVDEDVPAARRELERQFRTLLGVTVGAAVVAKQE